jgi:hypothetical protein
MVDHKNIAVPPELHQMISDLADATNRSIMGMVKEMYESYIRSIPVVGRISDGKVLIDDHGAEYLTEHMNRE